MSAPTIRIARPSDAAAILDVYGPYVLDAAVSFDESLPEVDGFSHHIAQHLEKYPWLVAEDAGCVVGYAYAGAHRARAAYRWSVESSVYLHPAVHRRGVGRRLYNELFELLRRQGLVQCFAGITLPNPASVGFHEHFGFQRVGVYHDVGFKMGAWRDVGWWEFQIQPPAAQPREPIAFPLLNK